MTTQEGFSLFRCRDSPWVLPSSYGMYPDDKNLKARTSWTVKSP